jgi:hypothetical protein
MLTELAAKKFTGAWIRIHDAGDFFSDDYLQAWLRICRARPDLHFYAYTKEVDRFRRLVEPDPPPNFLWVYSYGYLSGFTCCSRVPTRGLRAGQGSASGMATSNRGKPSDGNAPRPIGRDSARRSSTRAYLVNSRSGAYPCTRRSRLELRCVASGTGVIRGCRGRRVPQSSRQRRTLAPNHEEHPFVAEHAENEIAVVEGQHQTGADRFTVVTKEHGAVNDRSHA